MLAGSRDTIILKIYEGTDNKNRALLNNFAGPDATLDISSVLKAHFFKTHSKGANFTRRIGFSAYRISNGITRVFISSYYSCMKHIHLFEDEDQTPGRARIPASERSYRIPIQTICKAEEIVYGNEPF